MTKAHTPGPWISGFSPRRAEKNYVRKDYDHEKLGGDICYVTTSQADARLIAAAPEMLEALEALLRVEMGDVPLEVSMAAWKKAYAVAAKARGEAA